jgi:5,10-methylenetetrahydromethanopterin reductase
MLTLEAEFSPGMPLAEAQELARLVEQAGFDRLGISDVILWPDTFIVQALCAQVTHRVQIGSMVSNPYSRHPAVLAAAVADLQELSGGRAFLGLGVGAGLDSVGLPYTRPVATLRETVSILRRLLNGETVDHDGAAFSLHGARLRCPPDAVPPIAIGTRSPGVMRLAGEVADTALVGARYLSLATANTYRQWVAEGAARVGRSPASVEVAPRLTLCVSQDAEAARNTMRRDTAEFLVTLRPDDLAIEPERLAAIASALERARGWYFDPEAFHPPELDALVDDGLVDRFSVCGSPKDCLDHFRRLRDLGFRSVSLKLAPVRRPGLSMFAGLRETVTAFAEVLPTVQRLVP